MDISKKFKDFNRECIINLNPLSNEVLSKFKTPNKSAKTIKHTDPEPFTPKVPLEFSRELKIAINERNVLTSKTKKRVFDALDEIGTKSQEERRNFKRENALLEIVNSEIKYVKQLEVIIDFFMKPVLEKKLLINDDFDVLFGNINTIYNINKKLLEEIDKGTDNVARAFSNIAPFLKLYSVYAYEFKNILKILLHARAVNPSFATFVENQESRPEVQNKLSALLIAPIQRIPRYKLLLTQLHQLTKPTEKDYDLLTDCLTKIEDAADHLNKIVEDQENQQRLLELQRCLRSGEPNVITPGRKLEKEGILMKMSTKNTHSDRLYVVLMSDIIMFNKMKKTEVAVNSLKCDCIYPLNKCKVTEVLDKGCLKLSCQDEELILYHEQLSETKKWISKLNETIESYLENRKTLRKESSARRPVKRKDINEYHEVGLSPGRPLKKRKIVLEPTESSNGNRIRISSRRPIHTLSSSTPVKSQENYSNLSKNIFDSMSDRTNFSDVVSHIGQIKSENAGNFSSNDKEIFVFGRAHDKDPNCSKVGSFFKGVGSTIKGFFGFNKNS